MGMGGGAPQQQNPYGPQQGGSPTYGGLEGQQGTGPLGQMNPLNVFSPSAPFNQNMFNSITRAQSGGGSMPWGQPQEQIDAQNGMMTTGQNTPAMQAYRAQQQGGGMGPQQQGGGYSTQEVNRMAGRDALPQGIDPRAVAANPQGFAQWQQGAMQQEQQRPGSTAYAQIGRPSMQQMGPMQSGIAQLQGVQQPQFHFPAQQPQQPQGDPLAGWTTPYGPPGSQAETNNGGNNLGGWSSPYGPPGSQAETNNGGNNLGGWSSPYGPPGSRAAMMHPQQQNPYRPQQDPLAQAASRAQPMLPYQQPRLQNPYQGPQQQGHRFQQPQFQPPQRYQQPRLQNPYQFQQPGGNQGGYHFPTQGAPTQPSGPVQAPTQYRNPVVPSRPAPPPQTQVNNVAQPAQGNPYWNDGPNASVTNWGGSGSEG